MEAPGACEDSLPKYFTWGMAGHGTNTWPQTIGGRNFQPTFLVYD